MPLVAVAVADGLADALPEGVLLGLAVTPPTPVRRATASPALTVAVALPAPSTVTVVPVQAPVAVRSPWITSQ